MRVVLDANCFIDAVNPKVPTYAAVNEIIAAHRWGKLEARVSLHTLAELEKKPDAALDLARTISALPHWPIGTLGDQVATIGQLSGTLGDAKRNEEIQQELRKLANAGNDIRDRGAYVDALMAKADVLVTSDSQLSASGPAQRIASRFETSVLTPQNFLSFWRMAG
jgi:predicted nucleic acid-binding protein